MSIQMAELHYHSPPSYDATRIDARAEELLDSGIESPPSDSSDGTLLFFHKNHSVQYTDSTVPPQTAILASDKATDPAAYADRIQQSWACGDAAERIGASKCSRLVTELMASGLEPAERIRLFHGVRDGSCVHRRPNCSRRSQPHI